MKKNNQQGYSLLICLITISIISMITLALMEQSRWQQRLINLLIKEAQENSQLKMLLFSFINQFHNFNQDSCELPWQQSDQAFALLDKGEACCLFQQNGWQIRYLRITNTSKEPEQLAILAREDATKAWHKFRLYTNQGERCSAPIRNQDFKEKL